jgi:CheY-like chemotaxis protein
MLMFKDNRTILVVNNDERLARSLAKTLKQHGHTTSIARDADHALSILEFRAFDVLLVGAETLHGDDKDLIAFSRLLVPRPQVVVVGSPVSPDDAQLVLELGASLYLHEPINPEKLVEFLAPSPSRSSFSGLVEGVDLLEYLQFVLLRGQRTVLEITSSLGTQGRIYVSGATVLHAVCGILEGERALYICLCFREGTFAHLPWEDPEHLSINQPGDFVLMEAVRLRDDAWAETPKTPA